MRVYAIDKSTLALPETPELWKTYGCHKSCHGLGNVSAEICTAFDLAWRIPVAWNVLKATSSEHRLIRPLIAKLKRCSLMLLDNGFYSFDLFERIRSHTSHFLIPMGRAQRPKVVEKLGPGDYLCEIVSTSCQGTRQKKAERKTMIIRVIYAHCKGFRRRRLVTSLLDPVSHPASELTAIYHQRWHVETFYRDFKIQIEGNRWHCKSTDTFRKELISKFILITLTRMVMAEASLKSRKSIGSLSFSRAWTLVNVFLARVVRGTVDPTKQYRDLLDEVARHEIRSKPGRSYSRSAQERRKKSRGLDRGKVGRPPKKRKTPPPDRTENLAGRLLG